MAGCGSENNGEKKYRVTVIKQPAGAEIQARGILYDARLEAVLREGNLQQFRDFIGGSGHALPEEMMTDTLRLEAVMHRLILNRPELSEQHPASKEWLDNYTALGSEITSLNEASRIAQEKVHRLKQDEKPGRRVIYLKTFNAG
jgi:hypothetical protein